MRWPNEQDDPDMDQEYRVGDIVYKRGDMKTSLVMVRIGNSKTEFDYQVRTPNGELISIDLDSIATPCEHGFDSQSCQICVNKLND
jgi:hypothetical protein